MLSHRLTFVIYVLEAKIGDYLLLFQTLFDTKQLPFRKGKDLLRPSEFGIDLWPKVVIHRSHALSIKKVYIYRTFTNTYYSNASIVYHWIKSGVNCYLFLPQQLSFFGQMHKQSFSWYSIIDFRFNVHDRIVDRQRRILNQLSSFSDGDCFVIKWKYLTTACELH